MGSSVSGTVKPKDPRRVAAGRASALRRWGPDGRVVRLDSLDQVTREIVVSIIRARRNAAAAAESEGAA